MCNSRCFSSLHSAMTWPRGFERSDSALAPIHADVLQFATIVRKSTPTRRNLFAKRETATFLGFLIIWALTAFGLWTVCLLVPGVRTHSTEGLWLAALVLGFANAFIRPVLWVLTLPLTVLSFGLFALVVNGLLVWATASLVSDFEVDSFGSAMLAAFVMALLGIIGFILIEWWMLGSVNWMMMEHVRTHPF